MGARLREFDWQSTPLGPIAGWSPALRITVEQMMASAFPTCLFWGPDFIAVYNDGYKPMLGRKPEALGQPLRVTWAEAWDGLRPIAEKALAGQATFIEDHHLLLNRHGSLEDAWFTFSYSPVFDEHGHVVGMIDTVMETTAKVLAQRESTRQHQRQRATLEQMPGFVALLSGPEHRYEFVNDAYRDVAGHRDFIGRTVREALPELTEQGYFELLDRVYATGLPMNAAALPIRLDREDGERFIDLLFAPTRDAQGAIQGIFVGGYDVTERLRAENALRDAQERLHTMTQEALAERTAERDTLARIVETTDAQIQVVDADYRFLAINSSCARAYARIFGVSPAVGDSLLDLLARLPEAERDAALALWRRALAGESFKLVHDWGEGALRTAFEMNFEVLRAADGTQTGAFLTGNDISDRVRSEAALAATLEALRHAQKMEAVGQLTGGIAHDFNNLLMAIGGSLQTLQVHLDRGVPPGALRRYVEMGESAVQRAASLTHRLLAFSRRQTLDPRPTDVNALVHGMHELILRSVGPDVQLCIDAAPGAWPTRIDAPQLENALLNLCINARDAMTPGGGRLSIATASIEVRLHEAQRLALPEGDYVRLSVADTGSGIAPDDMSRIFEPFYTTKPQGQGTGLGLSMVYGFVQQSGGQVDVLSAPGEGTTMHLYLPRHHGAAVAGASLPPLPLPSGGGQTVLLIDDEEMLRVMLADVLEEAGYRVLTARDGTEGLQRLQDERQRVGLLITDVGLPGGMNGRQVADAARRHLPGLPVLFITGYAENAAVGNGLMEPGMEVMTKPFPVAALAARVQGMLTAG